MRNDSHDVRKKAGGIFLGSGWLAGSRVAGSAGNAIEIEVVSVVHSHKSRAQELSLLGDIIPTSTRAVKAFRKDILCERLLAMSIAEPLEEEIRVKSQHTSGTVQSTSARQFRIPIWERSWNMGKIYILIY